MGIKQVLKKSTLIRDAVRRHRLRTGQPRWEGLIERAGAGWREQLARASQNGPKILLATGGGGYLAGTRIESMLAVALALRGASPHVLLCDGMMPACLECTHDWYPDEKQFAKRGPAKTHCRNCFSPADAMFRSLGINVHCYSEFLTAEDLESAEQIGDSVPLADIGGYAMDGIAVGEHALAGALRFYARATLESSACAEIILRRYFKAALLTTFCTQRMLRAIPFAAAIFHHGIYVPQGVIGEVARRERVRVVNWHVAYRKRCFIFSQNDTYHHTLMSEPTAAWETMRWTPQMEQHIVEYLASREQGTQDWIHFLGSPKEDLQAIARRIGVDFSRPCVGMLTNVMWDAQLHYPANAFRNMLDWTLKTVGYFANRPELQLLIRVHPAEVRGTIPSRQPILAEIRKAYPVLPRNVFVVPPESRISTYAIMMPCNAAIIYGTKMGVELTAMGLPTIVCGEAWIRNKGITTDISSEEDYFRVLDRLPFQERLPEDVVRRARKYAYHFFFRRMIPLGFLETGSGIPGFEIGLTSLDALNPGTDLGLDVICDGILKGTEFVYPAETVPSGEKP